MLRSVISGFSLSYDWVYLGTRCDLHRINKLCVLLHVRLNIKLFIPLNQGSSTGGLEPLGGPQRYCREVRKVKPLVD